MRRRQGVPKPGKSDSKSKRPDEASKGKEEIVEEEKAQGTQWEQEEEGEWGEQGEQGAQEEQGEQGTQGVQGRDDGVTKPQESQSLFPESLNEDDIWKAIGLGEGFDEDSLEFRPRLISVVSPSLSTTSPPSEVSSPLWSEEEQLPRTEGSPASSSGSSHKSSVGLLLPRDPGLKGGRCFPPPSPLPLPSSPTLSRLGSDGS